MRLIETRARSNAPALQRLFIDRTSLRITAAALTIVLTVYPVAAFAQSVNNIVPDGRTATTVTNNGNTSTVTTATVSGPNAFNSFSQFSIGAGGTGNLILPNGATNLINLMSTNNPFVVNGVLNAYRNGQIGGNVYFASSGGFIVGAGGQVNVGQLHVTTPTREFIDSVIGPGGQINQSATNNLLAGTFPVSPDGNIRIRGKVNAAEAVRLIGQNVSVGPRGQASLTHAAQFASAVNAKGLQSASGIVVRNGSIQIVAAKDAKVNGRLTARRGGTVTVEAGRNAVIGAKAKITADNRNGSGGAIAIKAAQDVTVAGYGTISAKSQSGDAGLIVLKAGRNLTVGAGAALDASSAHANAGLVELSADGTFDVGANVKINLGAAHGIKGTLLIDPANVIVGDSVLDAASVVNMSNAVVANMIAALTDGGTFTILATNSITLAPHAVIDTRRLVHDNTANADFSSGNAFNVNLTAPTIDIQNGAKILARAVNRTGTGATAYVDGDVTLSASASQSIFSGLASATTSITVDGQITGGTISIGASSTAESNFTSGVAADFALVGETLAASLLGLNGGYVAANASATVAINSHANIAGSKNVSITASGSEDAEDPVIAVSALAAAGLGLPVSAAVVVGQVTGNVSTTIASNATVTAGGKLLVQATNSATINVTSLAASSTAQFMGVVAYAKANVTTQAIVESGAHLSSGSYTDTSTGTTYSGVNLAAVNQNSFSATATGVALSNISTQGGAGAAIALSDINTSATARLGASLGSSSNRNTGNVQVEATNNTTKNATSANMTVGTPALIGAIQGAAFDAAHGAGAGFLTTLMTPLFPVDFGLKAAGGLAYNTTNMSSSASIAASQGSVAPSIYASGDVTIVSNVKDDSIRNNASASALSSDSLNGEPYSLAVAVAYGSYNHKSNAYVGEAVNINAARIGVAANTLLPNTNTWLQWDSVGAVLGHINSNFGIVGNIVTSYSNATADAGDQLGLAGAVSYFAVRNNTTAWVASAANLTATSTDANWSTPTSLTTQQWVQALNITATSQINSIDIGGNFGALVLLNGTGSGGSAAGGTLNFVDTGSTTIAGVAGGASLNSANGIAVTATTTDFLVGVSPSSGAAAGALALSGIAAVALIDNETHASISNEAFVNAASVTVQASQNLSLLSIAGALNLGGSSAVGLAVAYLGATADTSAYIGDNSDDISQGPFASIDVGGGYGTGSIHADNLIVNATNAGRLTAASFAVAESDPSGAASFADKAKSLKASFDGGGAAGAATGVAKTAIGSASGAPGGFSIDIAGSSSVSNIGLDSSAYIKGASIDRFTTTNNNAATSVIAANNIVLDNGAGSAALNLLNRGAASAAVAGAIAIGLSDNTVSAYIDSTTLSNEKVINVEALNGGQQTAIGIGLAVSTGSNGGAGSASASIGIISDSTTAKITNSTINGSAASSGRNVTVDAYQTTRIGIGGGSLYVSGGQAGVGVALTYASITDPTGGKAVDAHISGTSISQFDTIVVQADSASRISAGAASGGLGSNGLAGAIVVDNIDPTITAYIDSGATTTISVTGDISVTADSAAVAALDNQLANIVRNTNNGNAAADVSGVDFSGAALGAEAGAGSAIFAGAGLVQAGKNNVGVALVYNTIAQTHSAYIAHVQITTNGQVNVTAVDSSQILGITIGFGLATGQFAGVGGTTVNTIENTVVARIGSNSSNTTNSTVSAAGVQVIANDTASIKASATVGGASTQGSAAGLALVYNEIDNDVWAEVTGSKLTTTGSVSVRGSSSSSTLTVALGVAMSSQVGLAGSVATNVLGTDVTADITGSSDVKANNNVAVLASNTDTASVYAGALAISTGSGAGGGSLVTSKITGGTSAYISGAGTLVDALGTSSSDLLSVNNGSLVTPVNLGTAGAPTLVTPNLSENQDSVKGLAVVSSSHQAVNTFVTSVVSSSGIAIMVNPITNVMGGTTNAYIESAQIDTRLAGTTALPQIYVAASSISASNAFGFGAAVPQGGGAAGGATIISTTMSRTSDAHIVNATVGNTVSSTPTVGAVTVKANAIQAGQSIAVGFDSGSIGLNVFNATTLAFVDGGSVTANSLTVAATDSTGIVTANGSGAYSNGGAAVGAAFVVQVSANTTKAYVGDEYHYEAGTAPNSTALYLSGALDIEATTNNNFKSYSIGGAIATGGAAIAGMANIEIANNTTIAGLYDTTVQSPTGGNAGAVTISATENVSIDEISGALSLSSSAGFGAAANILVFKSQTTAESRNSDIKSSGNVNVSAISNKDVTSYAIAGALGISVGIGGALGIIIIGTNTADASTQGDQNAQFSGTIAAVNNGTNHSQGSGATGSGAANAPHSDATSTYDVSSVMTGGNNGVTAQIAGGHITGNEVNVAATSATSAKMFLLGVGLGGNVGIGAAIGYTSVNSSILANLNAIVTASAVSVAATVEDGAGGKTIDVTSTAGGGAVYVGLAGAVAVSSVRNSVTAELGGQVQGASGGTAPDVGVMASDTSSQSTVTGGGSVGIAAIGASVATAKKSSAVTSKLLDSATINAANVIVMAASSGAVSAFATAVAGGVGAGVGAAATAGENSTVRAYIGNGASVTTNGIGVLVSASGKPELSSRSIGVAVGGGGLGASVAMSDAALTVEAYVGDNTIFSGGGLNVTALAGVPASGNTEYAMAAAGAGGILIGVQGSYAEAVNSTTVNAYGGTGVTLPNADVIIAAENDTNQYASATGVAVGGAIGLGATVTLASSNGHTSAYLGAGAITSATNTGSLSITATGNDTNVANATAGSGGVIAGSAAVATTNTTSTVNATLYGGDDANDKDVLYVAGLGVQAVHTTTYAANGDAFQASYVGASGGNARNDVVSNVTAEVGTNLIINSIANDMNVISLDVVNQFTGGARAGSGGVAAGAATLSDSYVTQSVATKIDAGTIFSLNDDPQTSLAKINIEAYAVLSTTDTVSLTAGGLFAGGGARSSMTATANVSVTIAAAELFSAGDIDIGTAAQMTASNNARADLYGLITGAGASTSTSLTANQTVYVGASRIEGWGLINIYAGQSGDGSRYSNITANATTVVYNQAVIPISAVYSGSANAYNNSLLTLDTGSKVLGVNNVFLGASPGSATANGKGTNYNPYLSLFSTENHDDNADANTTGNLVLNGLVVAGIHNQEIITIALNGSPVLSSGDPDSNNYAYGLALEQVSDPAHFNPTVSYNHQKIQYAVVGGFNPHQQVIDQLVALSGLSQADVIAQLNSANPTITVPAANDPTGDVQRQINTLIQQAPFTADAAGQAFVFNNILVSEGNVSILAKSITGSSVAAIRQGTGPNGPIMCSVCARGSAKISVDNQGLNFTEFGKLTVSGVIGGHINFTGNATSTTSTGVAYQQVNVGTTPSIIINASYNRIDQNTGRGLDPNGNPLATTPDIYFGGVVTNLNGLVSVTNQLGNVVTTQSIDAATFQLLVPNGSFTVNAGASTIFNTNNDVASQWAGVQYKPTDTLTAVEAVATYMGTYGGAYLGGDGNYHPYSYYYNNTGDPFISAPVTNYSNASAVFTARLLSLAYTNSLWSAVFLPMAGCQAGCGIPDAAGLATAEGTSVSNIAISGWERHWYEDQAYGDGGHGGPFNCSSCGRYFQIVNIQSQAVAPVTASNALNPPPSNPLIVGKAIIISAGVINVNGTIQSGRSSNFSANIGNDAQNAINTLLNDPTALANAKAAAATGHYVDLTPYVTANGGDVKIGAQYNAATNQILLNSVVQGTGGYVYLNGKIISTSTVDGASQGNIVVNGGAGTVTVNNTTGTALVTNTINTGVSAASVVQIVDQLKQQTTWYVYNAGAPAGQQVATYQQSGVNASGYQNAALVNISGPGGVQYAPQANMLYKWVDTAYLSRPRDADVNAYGWTFSDVSANSPTYPYTRVTSLVSGTQATNFQEVVTGQPVVTVDPSGVVHPGYHTKSFDVGNACCGTDFHGTWNQTIYDHLMLTLTNTVKASNPINIVFNGGGTSTVNVNSNASIVVNGPINNLQGVTALAAIGAGSSITAGSSNNNPVVSGTSVSLRGDGGIGSMATPLPVQAYGGTLSATSNDSDLAIAAIGSVVLNQIKVNTTHFNTTTGKAEPQGSVFLSATGDITSASPFNVGNPIIVGKNIEINTSGGAIGAQTTTVGGVAGLTNINPLVIQASVTTLSNGTLDGGLLNSTSSTGTYIVQSSGDVRLGRVQSNGPVFLESVTGSILNGLTPGGLTAAQTAYLENVWADLNLVNGTGAQEVTNYQAMINAAYNDYWQLRNIAFADGSTYAITALGTTAIGAQLIAQKVLAENADLNSAASQAAIRTAATNRFLKDQYLLGLKTADQLGVPLATLFGATQTQAASFQSAVSTTALTTALQTFDGAFRYQLPTNSALYANLTSGSKWSLDQLRYTVSAEANPANGVPPPSIAGLPLNVSGRQVMLYAPNGSIGSLAQPATFSFTSVDASSLSDANKALLASAGPGQLTVRAVTDPVTHIISYTVDVAQQSLVIVDPLGPASAKAKDQIYLGSATDMLLGGIPSTVFGPITAAQSAGIQTTAPGGIVRLDAIGSILGGVSGQVAISGNIAQLTLIAETGTIGQAPPPGSDPYANPDALLLALSGGAAVGRLDQASAAQGIYLRQTTGDLVLGNVTSGNGSSPIQFAATGSIYAEPQFTDRSFVHIAGSSLDVRAGGSISFNGAAFQPLQVKMTGAITGTATGDITILSPASDMTVGRPGVYGALMAGGAIVLQTVAGALTINGDVTSNGPLQLLANGAVIFGGGTGGIGPVASSATGTVNIISTSLAMGAFSAVEAAGVITVITTGDATLGRLASAASYVDAGNGASIIVSAGGVTDGSIFSNGDGRTNLVASGAGAKVSLTASGGMGTAAHRVGVASALLTATATNGDMYLNAAVTLEALLLSAVKGKVDMVADADLTIDSAVAGTPGAALGTFTVNAGGALSVVTATSSGSQTVHAVQGVTFTTLTATAFGADDGSISVVADNGAIQGTTVAAHGAATLTAATTNKGTAVTGTTGLVSLTGGGLVDWTTVVAGTTFNARSTGASINLGTAASGGSQTIHANDNVVFRALAATGITGDVADITVDADTGSITAQTVLAGGVVSQGEVSANGSARLTAATTNTGNSLVANTGLVKLVAGGRIDWTAVNAGTTVNAQSSGNSINFGTVTSGGSQIIHANEDVTFATLTSIGIAGDVADIDVTADTGKIEGTTVAANGSARLAAATTNRGTDLTAATGLASITGGGLVDWTTIVAGKTLNVRSAADSINIGTATSGGSQTIHANDNVTFRQLAATGTGGDIGDITVNADAGALTALSVVVGGVATQGSVSANGSARLTAATTNTGNTLTAVTGDAELKAGGLISWNAVTAGKAFTAISSGGAINLGTAQSGGSQTLHAHDDIAFNRLTTTGIPGDVGNIFLTSDTGSIVGDTIAANGDVIVNGGNSINFAHVQGSAVTFSTPHDITIADLKVFRSISLASDTMTVNAIQLPSTPPVTLLVTLTGYQGGVATWANIRIDPPAVYMDLVKVIDMNLFVDSPALTIASGYVPGHMVLTTPAGIILMNNRSPGPVGGVNLQLYQPGGQFSMSQFGNANYTSTQVVWYDTTISSTITTYNGGPFTGSSFVRNSLRDMQNGGYFDSKSALALLYLFGAPNLLFGNGPSGPVKVLGDGPAVNIQGLENATEVQGADDQGHKVLRKKLRATWLDANDGRRAGFTAHPQQ